MTATKGRCLDGVLVAVAISAAAGCSDAKVETGKHRGEDTEAKGAAAVASDAAPAKPPTPRIDAGDAVSAETVAAAAELGGLIEARVYFAEDDAVAQGIRAYFRVLNERTGKVQLREVTPEEDPQAARAAAETKGRMVVIDHGGRRRAIGFTVRGGEVDLHDLDTVVRAVLLRFAPVSSNGAVYRTVGHRELGAADSGKTSAQAWRGVRTLLGNMGLAIRDLSPKELAAGVPKDARAVLLLGPEKALNEREREALKAYVERGGSLLVALDPSGEDGLVGLSDYLGIRFEPVLLADDEHKIVGEDRAAHPTTRAFADHPAVRRVHEGGIWIPLLRAGVLWDAARRGGAMRASRTRIVVTAESAFLDRNDNGKFDAGAEKRGTYTVAVALEARAGSPRGRVVVFGDSQLFLGRVMAHFRGAELVCADVLRWLLRLGDGSNPKTPK